MTDRRYVSIFGGSALVLLALAVIVLNVQPIPTWPIPWLMIAVGVWTLGALAFFRPSR